MNTYDIEVQRNTGNGTASIKIITKDEFPIDEETLNSFSSLRVIDVDKIVRNNYKGSVLNN